MNMIRFILKKFLIRAMYGILKLTFFLVANREMATFLPKYLQPPTLYLPRAWQQIPDPRQSEM